MIDPYGYSGKQALVTGCSSGIGYAVVHLLHEAGAVVHGLDWRQPEKPVGHFSKVDLRKREAIDDVVRDLTAPIDALFNCAGLAPMHPWADVMAVNFIGMRYLSERILEKMPSGAAIVTVGSNGGAGWRKRLPELREFVATGSFDDALHWCEAHDGPQVNAYAFSKEAIVVWTLTWSAHTISRGVRLNCTSPGAVETPMLDAIEQVTASGAIDVVAQPIGRRSSALEQAHVLLMLNSARASYVNGVDLPVDGGFAAGRSIAG
jgi:NAD(P)-dependent dehydrogenase (short-subunit alcohol dehydrogenase family)